MVWPVTGGEGSDAIPGCDVMHNAQRIFCDQNWISGASLFSDHFPPKPSTYCYRRATTVVAAIDHVPPPSSFAVWALDPEHS